MFYYGLDEDAGLDTRWLCFWWRSLGFIDEYEFLSVSTIELGEWLGRVRCYYREVMSNIERSFSTETPKKLLWKEGYKPDARWENAKSERDFRIGNWETENSWKK